MTEKESVFARLTDLRDQMEKTAKHYKVRANRSKEERTMWLEMTARAFAMQEAAEMLGKWLSSYRLRSCEGGNADSGERDYLQDAEPSKNECAKATPSDDAKAHAAGCNQTRDQP